MSLMNKTFTAAFDGIGPGPAAHHRMWAKLAEGKAAARLQEEGRKRQVTRLVISVAAVCIVLLGISLAMARYDRWRHSIPTGSTSLGTVEEAVPSLEGLEAPTGGDGSLLPENIALSEASAKVSVKYTTKTQEPVATSLVWFSEEEMFSHWNMAFFRGKVTDLKNIELDFNGDKAYRALARVRVDRVLKGELAEGDYVTILLPCPVSEKIWVEDCGLAASLRIGDEAVFTPIVYDKASMWGQNGAWLSLKDLAPYGLADGARWVFLATEQGVRYMESAYPGFHGGTLEDAEAYVAEMLETASAD